MYDYDTLTARSSSHGIALERHGVLECHFAQEEAARTALFRHYIRINTPNYSLRIYDHAIF